MLEIYLHGEKESGFLDLFPGTTLEFEGTNSLFDEELKNGEFSLPIDIPWTDKNRRLWDFAEQIENKDTRKNYRECTVYDSGFPELIRAKITIIGKSGKFDYTSGRFSASISGTKGLFGSAIRNKKVNDLQLEGKITWEDYDSREFATRLMKGEYPQYHYISFAPMAFINYFDESKNYNGEFLAKETANNIVSIGGGLNDWVFGRPRSTNEFEPTTEGEEEHIDYRSIPFFKFTYILRKIFEETGYNVHGEIFNLNSIDKVFLYNNAAIEFYSSVVFIDYNRAISPKDHLPDLPQDEFLRYICQSFNVFPVFYNRNDVELKFRNPILESKEFIDITGRTNPSFSSEFTESTENDGYSLEYGWDENDDYINDRVKDLTDKTLVATVSTRPELGTVDIGRPLTTDDMAFVTSENMYYIVADGTSIPVKWDAWSENLDKFTKGRGDRTVTLPFSTLCTYVEFDEANALYIRKDKLGCRQTGTYWNNKLSRVVNPFGLRLFFITRQVINGNEIPVTHNHYTSAGGTILTGFSFALNAEKGMVPSFHELWQDAIQRSETIKIQVRADKKFMEELSKVNIVRIKNVFFLYKLTRNTLPLGSTIELEIVPL